MDTLSGETSPSKLFCVPSGKVYSIRKYFASVGIWMDMRSSFSAILLKRQHLRLPTQRHKTFKQRWFNVLTVNQRCFNVMCLLGFTFLHTKPLWKEFCLKKKYFFSFRNKKISLRVKEFRTIFIVISPESVFIRLKTSSGRIGSEHIVVLFQSPVTIFFL